MGALPTIKRFLADDFPGQAEWIGNLLFPLNLLLNTLYSNLNNGLTIQNNMQAQVKTLAISGALPTTSFPWKYASAPIGVTLINIVQTDGTPATITLATTVAFSYAAGVVTISNVTGLNATHTYNATFIVWGA
jgi:hypothetical protein